MRYYPLNRVKTNQRTSGGEFTLNGVEYSGPYYETYNGQVFSGADPVQGPSQPLARIQLELTRTLKETNATSNNLVTSQESNIYDNINPKLQPIKAFLTPQPYFPQPTDTDYKRGSIIRYFAKKRDRAGYVFEINKDTHDSLQVTDSRYDYISYEAISSFWQITGPLHDDRTARVYKIAGIIDTNKRLIDLKEPVFAGLVAYIGGDYTKFAKPTT